MKSILEHNKLNEYLFVAVINLGGEEIANAANIVALVFFINNLVFDN